MLTRDQNYAKKVFGLIETYKSQGGNKDRYGGMAHTLPVLVRSAGLCQALTFVQTQGDESCNALLEHLAKTVLGDGASAEKLAKQARECELIEYTRLTREVLQALTWFKRFAKSVLETDATSGDLTGTQT